VADLSCRELVELVTDHLEGALSPADVARFEAHLALCPGCERYLAQVSAAIVLARSSGRWIEPGELSPLLDAFRDWHASR
jgi:anti-sigma factor RsiW